MGKYTFNYNAKAIKRILLCIICISIGGIFFSGCESNSKKSPELTIRNMSKQELTEVSIQYLTSQKKFDLGVLRSNMELKHNIEAETDDSIKLFFTDSLGNKQQEVIVGYVTRGMDSVSISITQNGDGKWVVLNK